MMKWIRWWGLAVFLVLFIVLAAAWYLLAPWFVKSSIEDFGSEAVGAQVNVDKVVLGLFPAKFSLENLQVTNSDAPMTNTVQVDKISLEIDQSPLFWKKLVIEEMVLSGVKFSTPRKTSGKLSEGRKTQQMLEAMNEFKLPDLSDVDTDKLVAEAELITPGRIEKFNETQKEMTAYWGKALDQKQLDAELVILKAEFNKLKDRAKKNKFNLLKDRKKWKRLKKNINLQKDKIAGLKKQMAADKKKLSEQLKSIKRGPADDLEQLMSKVGMGAGGLENLSEKFLGPKLTPWVMQALELAKNYQSTPNTEQQEESYQRGVGRRFYFKDNQPWPEVLIKNIVFSGEQGSWQLGGKGNDIAIPPWQWQKPAQLEGSLKGDGNANFNIKSDWNTETEMLTLVSANANNWKLTDYTLKEVDGGSYKLLSAVINSQLQGELTLETVNLKLNISLAAPKFSFPDNLSGWQRQIAEGVNQQKNIDITVIVSGSLLEPKLEIHSGLEKLFQQMLKARLTAETDKIKNKLTASVTEKIGDVDSIQGLDYSSFQNQLNLGDEQLADLLSGIKL